MTALAAGLDTRSLTLRFALLLLLLAVAACGGASYDLPPPTTGQIKIGNPYKVAGIWYHPKAEPYYNRTGVASWYGKKFHGRATANGERYNMNALTAAHTTLPLPSLVRVTNLHNGRSVVLRVNDRGPFARGRIIDVSRKAAQVLGFEKRGVAKVRVEVVGSDGRPRRPPGGRKRTAQAKAVASGQLFIQAGAFIDRRTAARIASSLDRVGAARITEITRDGRRLYRVRIGPLATIEDADAVLGRVIASGNDSAQIVID